MKNKWWESDLSDVKVGDTLWSIHYGYCEVVEVINDKLYPIKIKIPCSVGKTVTLDGKIFGGDKFPTVWKECPFDLPVERPDFKMDHPVFVRDCEGGEWEPRNFAEWPNNPKDQGIICWEWGKTKHTSREEEKSYWKQWKDAKEGK